MPRLLFFLSIIMHTCHNYASENCTIKESYKDVTIRYTKTHPAKNSEHKKQIPSTPKEASSFNQFAFLPAEIKTIIIQHAAINKSAKTVKEATETVKALLIINKYYNTFIDNQLFSDNLIKELAAHYNWTHQTVAKSLGTKESKKRLALQYKLKKLCCLSEDDDRLLPKLKNLVSNHVDLEFTYNYRLHQKTPLMMAMDCDNNMFEYLLDNGANINGTNSVGLSPLHLASSSPINKSNCMKLITHPAIAINQQNANGETALLHSITHAQRIRTNHPLETIVKEMLKAGADPQCANKQKLTPLKAAKKIHNKRITTIIQKAIKA